MPALLFSPLNLDPNGLLPCQGGNPPLLGFRQQRMAGGGLQAVLQAVQQLQDCGVARVQRLPWSQTQLILLRALHPRDPAVHHGTLPLVLLLLLRLLLLLSLLLRW